MWRKPALQKEKRCNPIGLHRPPFATVLKRTSQKQMLFLSVAVNSDAFPYNPVFTAFRKKRAYICVNKSRKTGEMREWELMKTAQSA